MNSHDPTGSDLATHETRLRERRVAFTRLVRSSHRRHLILCVLGLTMFAHLYLFAIPSTREFAFISIAACVLAMAVVALSYPRFICPACDHNVDRGTGDFCPLCGAAGFTAANVARSHSWPQCPTCQGQLYRNKGKRAYSIRHCPHCGEHLDSEGV